MAPSNLAAPRRIVARIQNAILLLMPSPRVPRGLRTLRPRTTGRRAPLRRRMRSRGSVIRLLMGDRLPFPAVSITGGACVPSSSLLQYGASLQVTRYAHYCNLYPDTLHLKTFIPSQKFPSETNRSSTNPTRQEASWSGMNFFCGKNRY